MKNKLASSAGNEENTEQWYRNRNMTIKAKKNV